MKLEDVLAERKSRYGDFRDFAQLAQALKGPAHSRFNWHATLEPMHREAIDMILHKISRIINGDPNYADSWKDIAGYAQCVADRLPTPKVDFPPIVNPAPSLKEIMDEALKRDAEARKRRQDAECRKRPSILDGEGSGGVD